MGRRGVKHGVGVFNQPGASVGMNGMGVVVPVSQAAGGAVPTRFCRDQAEDRVSEFVARGLVLNGFHTILEVDWKLCVLPLAVGSCGAMEALDDFPCYFLAQNGHEWESCDVRHALEWFNGVVGRDASGIGLAGDAPAGQFSRHFPEEGVGFNRQG